MPPPIDHLKLIIQRYDAYITASNVKAAFLLAFNTFICGGILTGYKTLSGLVTESHSMALNVLLLIIFCIGITCLFFVLQAMYPYLSSENSSLNSYHSLIFFKSVSEFATAEDYAKKLNEQTDEQAWNDLARQAYAVASGLNKKYRFIAHATTTIYAQLALILLLVGVIICDKL